MSARRLFGSELLGDGVVSHVTCPTPIMIEDRIRIFVGSRDNRGRTRLYAVDVDPEDLGRIIAVKGPLLALGGLGHFDEDGTTPSSIIALPDGRFRLYYIGWNRAAGSVSYRLSIGSAISEDGLWFEREADGPILDRTRYDPILATAPHVQLTDYGFEMIYVSGTRWIEHKGHNEPCYKLARAVSANGIDFERLGRFDVPLASEALARPAIFRWEGETVLTVSHRCSTEYRHNPKAAYKLAFLRESPEGWDLLTDELVPCGDEAWCSVMRCYGHAIDASSGPILLYNGDGFGSSGVMATNLPTGVWRT